MDTTNDETTMPTGDEMETSVETTTEEATESSEEETM